MKRPNYKKWVELQCLKRALEFCITNSEIVSVSEPDTYKVYIGFRGYSLQDVEMRGTILYIISTDNIYYRIAKFLKEHQTVMI